MVGTVDWDACGDQAPGMSTMQVHVITAGARGHTAEIGETIAARLRELGHDAATADATTVTELPSPDDPIVLGSPIYMGEWLKPARALLDRLAADHTDREIFVFSVDGDPAEPAVVTFAVDRARSQRTFAGPRNRDEIRMWADDISDELIASMAPLTGVTASVE